MRNLKAKTALLVLAASVPAIAQAQVAGDQDPSSNESEAAEAQQSGGEILVTARRREESIRDVPGTISAVTAEQLESKGPVTGAGDLLSTIPGVRFNGVAAENLSEVSIRGSGTQRATGADSGVGLFVNGAYVGSSTLGGRNFKTLDYFDIERVEALEGPQGALYGRNSEFGTINIVLARPKFEDSGYARGMYTFGLHQARLAAVTNIALSDTAAIRIGGEVYGQSKGFYYDPNKNEYYDDTNGYVVRGQVRHRSGPLDLTVMFDAQDLSLPSFVNSLVVPGGGVNPQIPLGFTQDRFIVPHEGRDGLQQNVLRTMVLASYDLGFATLESATMATRWRSRQQFAGIIDFNTLVLLRQQGQIGAYPYNQTTTDVRDRTFYQDVHLTGTAANDALTWIVGAEGLWQRDFYQRTVASSPCAFTLAAGVCTGRPETPVCLKPLPTSTNCPTPFPLTFGVDGRYSQTINSLAAYASLQYTIGNLSLTGEGRITRDKKRASDRLLRLYTLTPSRADVENSFSSSQPAWTVTAAYKTPDASETLIYAKVGTGYRAGGVNIGTFNAAAPNPFKATYDNEDTISYEVGIKSGIAKNIFVRVSAYLSRTSNAITSINDGCAVTNACGTALQIFNVNGGTIHAKGLEGSIEGRFPIGAGQLSINLNATTQRAHFERVNAGSGLPVLGSSVAQIPDLTMSSVIDLRQPLSDTITGFINLSYSGQRGGVQDTITLATPQIDMDDFDLFGGRIGLNIGSYQIAAFVKNATDQKIQLLKFNQAGYPLSVRWNPPRTFGLSASYKW